MGTRKIRITKILPMSKLGMSHWHPNLQRKIHPNVFRNMGHYYVDYEFLSTRENLAIWIHSHFGAGQFLISFFRKGYYLNKLWLRSKSVAKFDLRTYEMDGKFYFTDKGIGRFSWFEKEKKKLKKNASHINY